MKPTTVRITYWTLTIIFFLFMLMDGFGGITRAEAGKEVMIHLGYPIYVLSIFGAAKILGALAILQTKYPTIKEWAYAGFAFNFIGASASRAFAGDGIGLVIFPLIILAFMLTVYFFWRRYSLLTTRIA